MKAKTRKTTAKKRKAAPKGDGAESGLQIRGYLARRTRAREDEGASPALWLEARRRAALAVLEAGCYRPRTAATVATVAEESRIRKLKPKAARESLLATNAALEKPLTAEERADHTAVVTVAETLLSDPADAVAWVALSEALVRVRFSLCARQWAGARAAAGHVEAVGLYRELWPERQAVKRRDGWPTDGAMLERLVTMQRKDGRTKTAADNAAKALGISRTSLYEGVKRARAARSQ